MQFSQVKHEQLFFIFIYVSAALCQNASIQIPAPPFSDLVASGKFMNPSWASGSASENGDNNGTSS